MIRTILLSAIFFTVSLAASGQDLDVVLERHFKAMGQQAQESIRSLQMEVTEIDGFGKGQKYEQIKKRPYKIRKEGTQIGEPFVMGYDGDTAWVQYPNSGETQILDSLEVVRLLIESVIGSPLTLRNREDVILTVKGSGYIDRKPNYILRMTIGLCVVDFFIDKKDFLLKKVVTYSDLYGQVVDVEVLYSNYQRLGNFLFPYKMERYHGDDPVIDVIIGEIAVGIGASNSVFRMPKD